MIDNKIHPIPETSIEAAKIENLQTRPNSQGLYGSQAFSPTKLKQRMDALPILAIDKVNEIIDEMKANGKVASTITFERDGNSYTLQGLFDAIFNGVLSELLTVNITSSDNPDNLTTIIAKIKGDIDANKSELEDKIDEAGEELYQFISGVRDVASGADAAVLALSGEITDLTNSLGGVRADVNNAFCDVSYDGETGVLTFSSKTGSISIDLPLEMIVKSGKYNEDTQSIDLTLANGDELVIPVSGLLTDVNTHIEETVDNAVSEAFGDIDTALDYILAIQNKLIGGKAE